ncbi:MAG TPA: Maf family protein [Terriglobales bacterium]|nr:Maf family protein [Terriglobales bacterium]
MQNSKLILASASPRRAELLRNAGIEFEVVPAQVRESRQPGESPEELVRRLAQEKAQSVAMRELSRLVLGADTEVVIEGEVLGKPGDAEDAARMLRRLSGRSHLVTTGVCLLGPGVADTRTETTLVSFDQLSEDEIRDYIASGEPMDKAGAYAIQGIASRWITRLEGCYFNVVGLPVPLVYRMLQEHRAL